MEMDENILKAGDVCLDCQRQGFEKRLRYFKLNLNGDTLLKCESNECMYPYNDEMFSSDEDEDVQNNSELNGIQMIDDILQQIENDSALQNLNSNLQIMSNINSPNCIKVTTQSEIYFVDPLSEIRNEHADTEFLEDTKSDYLDKNHVLSLPTIESLVSGITTVNDDCNILKLNQAESEDCRQEDATQSDEAIKIESSILNSFPKIHTLVAENPSDCNTDPQIQAETQNGSAQVIKPKINIQSVTNIETKSIIPNSLQDTGALPNKAAFSMGKRAPFVDEKTVQQLLKDPKPKIAIQSIETLGKGIPIEAPQLSNTSKSSISDIPKANIMTGRDLLKRIAMADEKSNKLCPKLKGGRRNTKVKRNCETKNMQETGISQTNFNFDKLTELLNRNILKSNIKTEK